MTNRTTPETSTSKMLAIPLLAVAFGIGYLVVGLLGDQPSLAIGGPVLMFTIAGVLLLVRRRSETVQGLLDRRDERINTLDLRATAVTGIVLIFAVLGGFFVEVGLGNSGQPYLWLATLGGITYLATFLVLRLRG